EDIQRRVIGARQLQQRRIVVKTHQVHPVVRPADLAHFRPDQQSRRYTRRAVPAKIFAFSSAEQPAVRRFSALNRATKPMPIFSTGKLLSAMQRSAPNSSTQVST